MTCERDINVLFETVVGFGKGKSMERGAVVLLFRLIVGM